jgi:stearoyl-CoA desaturase (delta-9 desaturase)
VAAVAYFTALHAGCLLAPATFSWPALACFAVCLFLTGCVGITFSFHRNLSHKSFALPKPLEYAAAYCGVLAAQGGPIEWVSNHRYHHVYCDTPGDPHTPYEGFWWSHVGWLLDRDATMARVKDRSNVADLGSQRFYRWLEYTNALHVAGSAAALFALGGLPFLVWGFCVRLVWVYHITWFVNSLAHVYGSQPYVTGDLSRNNPLVALLAFGEGWHNNHHAFAFSARHGLEWWQFDVTWALICALQLIGLATKVKLPTDKQKAAKLAA